MKYPTEAFYLKSHSQPFSLSSVVAKLVSQNSSSVSHLGSCLQGLHLLGKQKEHACAGGGTSIRELPAEGTLGWIQVRAQLPDSLYYRTQVLEDKMMQYMGPSVHDALMLMFNSSLQRNFRSEYKETPCAGAELTSWFW